MLLYAIRQLLDPIRSCENECHLKVQRESYAELSQTAGTGKQEVKVKTPLKAETKERTPLTKQNLSWNHESEYTSNEIKVVKTPRSAKKKNPSFLSDKTPEFRRRFFAYHKELYEERKANAAKRAQMQNSL